MSRAAAKVLRNTTSSHPFSGSFLLRKQSLVRGTRTGRAAIFSTLNMDFSVDGSVAMALTENKSATFSSSGSPCLDFFFQIVPDTPPATIVSLLSLAWGHDPLTTLKLIFHLRGVRGTGKSNKEAFYTCCSWLCKHHPKTLVSNVRYVPAFGYYKDLLEIVLQWLEELVDFKEDDDDDDDDEQDGVLSLKRKRGGRTRGPRDSRTGRKWNSKASVDGEAIQEATAKTAENREARIAASLEQDREESRAASARRKERRSEMTETFKRKYAEVASFASLCDAVVDVFAKQLLEDKKELEKKNLSAISYAAKWAPSARRCYDLRTGLHGSIARRIFAIEAHPDLAGLDEGTYSELAQQKLTREFITPLRKALEIPERYMSANKWNILPYERVPSVAMKNYVEHFVKHDKDRYLKFLENVSAGNKKVAAGALLPHNIVKEAAKNKGKPQGYLAEAQWKRMVKDLKETGTKLSSSLAVCDVSGSMCGTPMDVCIALGLLVADLTDEPWKNHVCTFSSSPEIHVIEGETLAERYSFTKRMDWGMNTNFQLVFKKLLELAEASNLPPEKMIQRLFVFSDMEFDQASAKPWETDYMKICEMYGEAGYSPPEIVFWNLRDSRSTPVLGNQKGVALVSGFSKNLLKVFLEDGPLEEEADQEEETGEEDDTKVQIKKSVDPMEVMIKALSDELYGELHVVD